MKNYEDTRESKVEDLQLTKQWQSMMLDFKKKKKKKKTSLCLHMHILFLKDINKAGQHYLQDYSCGTEHLTLYFLITGYQKFFKVFSRLTLLNLMCN